MITPNDRTPSPQYTHLLGLIESIRKKTNELESVWEKRRLRVELFVQIKHFEMHSREVSSEEAKKKKKEERNYNYSSANCDLQRIKLITPCSI